MDAFESEEAERRDASPRRRSIRIAAAALVFAILCAPSFWMIDSVPPLWKDTDAYLQVTEPPNVVTILQYAPGYCFSARVPLYLGYACERLRAGASLPPPSFFAEPTLTDSGVWLLLVAQHAGLWLSSYLVIASATRVLLLRVVLAGLWAVNPLLYVFAHTVGSEALSAILLLLIGAVGWRIVQRPRRRPGWWILFALLLAMSLLTRHINGVAAALLPLAFALSTVRCARAERLRAARYALVAITVSVAGILVADATFRVSSRAAGLHFHRRAGFSFLFRLNFFADLSAADRENVLDRAAAHSRSRNVSYLLDALRAAPVTTRSRFDPMALQQRTFDRLPAEILRSLDKTDEVLNEAARAFLVAPSMPYLRAVVADLAHSQRTTVTDMVGQLLMSTTFYFKDPSEMPKCSGLITFRATDPREFLSQIYKRRYFASWKRCTYLRVLFSSVAALVIVIVGGRARPASYAIALLLVGFLSMIGNSMLNEFQPRYTLPMWELTTVALTILLPGTIAELKRRVRKRFALAWR